MSEENTCRIVKLIDANGKSYAVGELDLIMDSDVAEKSYYEGGLGNLVLKDANPDVVMDYANYLNDEEGIFYINANIPEQSYLAFADYVGSDSIRSKIKRYFRRTRYMNTPIKKIIYIEPIDCTRTSPSRKINLDITTKPQRFLKDKELQFNSDTFEF